MLMRLQFQLPFDTQELRDSYIGVAVISSSFFDDLRGTPQKIHDDSFTNAARLICLELKHDLVNI